MVNDVLMLFPKRGYVLLRRKLLFCVIKITTPIQHVDFLLSFCPYITSATTVTVTSSGWATLTSLLLQCESKKSPPLRGPDFFIFYTSSSEFLIDFLHTYYTFISTLDYTFLYNYPRFWRSYAILSATT